MKFKVCVLVILSLLLITGCGISEEEKLKRERYFIQAKENAVNYIENKYGFTPHVGTAECTFDNSDMFSSDCKEEVLVNASYNDKWFEILINGAESTIEGIDNYQYDEITKDVLNLFEENFGFKHYKYIIEIGIDENNMINKYYTKDNLIKFIEETYFSILLEYVDEEKFDTITNSQILNHFKRIKLINYYSKEACSKATSHWLSDKEYEIKENSLYIKSAIYKDYDDFEYYDKFNIKKYNDMYFLVDDNTTLNIKKSSLNSIKNWDGKGAYKAKLVSNAYSIDSNSESIYIYIPVKKYKFYDPQELSFAYQCYIDGDIHYFASTIAHSRVGDYYVEQMNLSTCQEDMRFGIVKSRF